MVQNVPNVDDINRTLMELARSLALPNVEIRYENGCIVIDVPLSTIVSMIQAKLMQEGHSYMTVKEVRKGDSDDKIEIVVEVSLRTLLLLHGSPRLGTLSIVGDKVRLTIPVGARF